jgi:ribosomal protein S18 acetylase RimI-like enzyme
MTTPDFHNSFWTALTGRQQYVSIGDELAKRYLPEISPFAAIKEASPETFASLERLAKPGESLVLFSESPLRLPSQWELGLEGDLLTMVLNESLSAQGMHPDMIALNEADVPDMLALTAIAQPGPFCHKTILLGDYYGIRLQGHLVAMAGERMRIPGYTEISAVCTHPDFQGQGLAGELVLRVAKGILERDETPMLRVLENNQGAVRLYQKLGFRSINRIRFINFKPYPTSEIQAIRDLQLV